MKSITLLTLFPEILAVLRQFGVISQALERGLVQLEAVDIREFAVNEYGSVDDRPYGGGPGMVMRVEPVVGAIRSAKARLSGEDQENSQTVKTVLMSPQGVPLSNTVLRDLLSVDHLVMVAGRYEGVDERVSVLEVDQEISIGDYVLTGGELPALVLMDALIRLVPGVLGNSESALQDSFQNNQLGHPQYTRPAVFEGLAVPEVLLSGDHQAIADWRVANRQQRTLMRRPDLLS